MGLLCRLHCQRRPANAWSIVEGKLYLNYNLEIDITPLIASAGIVGIAVALAARDTLVNFFDGINTFIDNPFTTGNKVILESGDRCVGIDIGVRSTLIRTRDDKIISMPNSKQACTKSIDESAPEARVRFRFFVDSGIEFKLLF